MSYCVLGFRRGPDTGIARLCAPHAGKRKADDDPMEIIAGSNGLTASVDDVFVWFTPTEVDVG
jgi:hypothetical protein